MNQALGICLVLFASGPLAADEPLWRYVSNDTESGFSPMMRRLPLDETQPEDVEFEGVVPQGAQFGQFRYGSFDARRVLIVVSEDSDNNPVVYVDANRDRYLAKRERVEGKGPVWRIPLAAEFVKGKVAEVSQTGELADIYSTMSEDPRFLKIRLSRSVLSIGTDGWIEGTAPFAGKSLRVRRVDANANGQYADPTDLVWFDLNADNRWDRFRERFPLRPIVRLGDTIFTNAADIRGQHLRLSEVEGTGTLSLQLEELRQRGLSKISVVMAGRAGTIVQLNEASTAVEVPVDDYRPVNVVATFERAESPKVWRFEFVRLEAVEKRGYHAVEADADTTLNPLDALAFGVNLNRDQASYTVGANIVCSPTLTTGSGLRIQSVKFGATAEFLFTEPKATLKLLDPTESKTLATRTSGFT